MENTMTNATAPVDETQLAKSDGGQMIASSGDPITDLISRVASDPDASIETLERMIALRDSEQQKAAEREFNAAFARAQENMPAIPKRGKGHVSDYALWEDVNKRIVATLSEYGLSISYTSKFESDSVTVRATLRHAAGHSISGDFIAPIEQSKAMNGAQARGSAMSYGKRYVTINLLSLTTHGEDDDAFAAAESDAMIELRTRIGKAQDIAELDVIRAEIMTGDLTPQERTLAGHVWTAKNKTMGKANADA